MNDSLEVDWVVLGLLCIGGVAKKKTWYVVLFLKVV